MDFATWFKRWVAQHPLNVPPAERPDDYAADVMRRVRGLHEPSPARRVRYPVWHGWVTLTAGLATAAVGLILVLTLTPQSRIQLTRAITPAPGGLMRLADSSTEDSWMDQTLQLLDELNEELPADNADEGTSNDDWLKELDTLEQHDQASPS